MREDYFLKNLHLYILITVICISISGCGKTGADNSNTYNLTEETPDLSSPDNIQNHDSQTEKPVDKEEDNSAPASTPEITSMSSAKPGIKKEIISAGKDYSWRTYCWFYSMGSSRCMEYTGNNI